MEELLAESKIELLKEDESFGGQVQTYRHNSPVNNCDMQFSIYLPPLKNNNKAPVLTWLSGLTCNEDTFMIKAGAQRMASELGIVIVAPDTSPRVTIFLMMKKVHMILVWEPAFILMLYKIPGKKITICTAT